MLKTFLIYGELLHFTSMNMISLISFRDGANSKEVITVIYLDNSHYYVLFTICFHLVVLGPKPFMLNSTLLGSAA